MPKMIDVCTPKQEQENLFMTAFKLRRIAEFLEKGGDIRQAKLLMKRSKEIQQAARQHISRYDS